MAFMISKAPPSFSDSENPNNNGELSQGGNKEGIVSSQLLLKSAGKMDRDVVLRRIRYYKRLNKVKRSFEGLVGASGGSEAASATADEAERWWLQQHDVFSSP